VTLAAALRMNLNSLLRHEVLNDAEVVDFVAAKIADVQEIHSSRRFPYQYLSAYLNERRGRSAAQDQGCAVPGG